MPQDMGKLTDWAGYSVLTQPAGPKSVSLSWMPMQVGEGFT